MIKDALLKRRSIYALNKEIGMSDEDIQALVEDMVRLVPDAFDMKSQKVVLALGDKHDKLWDAIYDEFGGKVAREKIDSFKAAAGTVLYFYDNDIVKGLQEKFPAYADNFPVWANHANAMLQSNVWVALRELNIGANLQHYNPVIDETVRKLFNIPESFVLVAQMPFGKIVEQLKEKEPENIKDRVVIKK